MNFSGKFSYFFRRYPVLRLFIAIFIAVLIVGSIFLVNYKTLLAPEIESIIPPVGSPGDVVLIRGKNFGDIRDMSYVEIAGTKLTSSSYISWSDNTIKIVLPADLHDGLVFVGNRKLRSKPALFANEVDIPVPVPTVQHVTKPVITELSAEKVYVGDILTISGNNFGENRNDSKVLFTIDYNNKIKDADYVNVNMLSENMIAANEDDFDYVSWSNTEIKVYVPDGAKTGVIIVNNGKEKSEPKDITINNDAGEKEYTNKKIYLIQYSADIADVVSDGTATITLRCPIPYKTAAQPDVENTENSPEPVLLNYHNNLIHQISGIKNGSPKSVFTQTFVITVFEIHSQVNHIKIGNYKNVNKSMLSVALRPDSLVHSDNVEIINLAKEIAGKEKNQYKVAREIYNYMCKNFSVVNKNRKNGSDPVELLKLKKGDAYDFAVIYTALLRAVGIPALTDGGILISQDMQTQAHWWCEFYVDKVGWIPVDPALGAGLEYKKWADSGIENDMEFYFGNMDSHHIIFSRGWNQLKPFSADNKIVQQPRSFALQSIWEEANATTKKYSSYWSIPVVKGVY